MELNGDFRKNRMEHDVIHKSYKYLLVTLLIGATSVPSSASALTYQSSVGVSFDFSSSLTLTLSSNSLVVSNLAPGASGNSNEINVTVVTNNAYGYKVNATVGSSTNATRDLKHTASGSSAKFSSINFNANSTNYPTSISSDNTWGYSIDSGSHYNGLPLYTDTTNIAVIGESNDPANDSIPFLIGAKAASSQASGEYTNIINFQAVTNPGPVSIEKAFELANKTKQNGYYKMQDMSTSICESIELVDDQLQLIDARDNKVYWIAKLQDGHCWMTQNLDLNLRSTTLTHNSTTLYHDDTDLGWGSDTATTSWIPERATIDATGGTISFLTNDVENPYSVDPGDYYYTNVYRPDTTTIDYLNATNTDYFNTSPYSGNGTHGHVGNYYNWTAAIASNDSSSFNTSTYANVNNNPQNSICPAGWRLPTATSATPTYSSDGSRDEFARLAYLYADYGGTVNDVDATKLEIRPLFFIRSGEISYKSDVARGMLWGSGHRGNYWSSTIYGGARAYVAMNGYGVFQSDTFESRYYCYSVRCVAR